MPPVTFTSALTQYVVPFTLGTVVMDIQWSAIKVVVEVGLVHRFVTIIGHHPPDARRYPSGIVSPVKKPGSPPPHGSVVSVGAFDEDIAHHAYRADRLGVELDAD